ncbi:MAG: hypothetical protein DRG78_11440 [Epsilonproteobacteria bacterium]|nr:MAG: hypothetical protein DRG78_11440 [Campylobacterota bacterium]
MNKIQAANNINYYKSHKIKQLRDLTNKVINKSPKEKQYLLTYCQNDESMEPQIYSGQDVTVNKLKTSYVKNDIYLVSTPYGKQIRKVEIISDETIKLECCNNNFVAENFLIDEIGIIGKVVNYGI